MDAKVVRELGVEGADEEPSLPEQHGLAVQLGEDLDGGTGLVDARRPDEDPAKGLGVAGELQVGLEARDLPPVGVPPDGDVHEAEVLPVEEDHPGAGPEYRPLEPAESLLEAVDPHEPGDRGRLAAGDHEPVEPVQLLRLADFHRFRAEPAQDVRVLAEVPLDRQNTDAHGRNGTQDEVSFSASQRLRSSSASGPMLWP